MGSVTFTPQYLEPTATHYRAALEVSLNDGEIAKLVVEVPRTEAVDRVAQRIKQIVESAPVGADLTAWYADGRDGGEPGAGYLKLVAHEGRAMVMERAAVMVKQRRLPALVKEFCGEWTTATADRAHAFLSQARAGDVLNLGVLQALQVWAEGGDPRAQQAVRRLNFINEGVAKGLPRPSEVTVLPPVDPETGDVVSGFSFGGLFKHIIGIAKYAVPGVAPAMILTKVTSDAFMAKHGRRPTRVELLERTIAQMRGAAVIASVRAQDATQKAIVMKQLDDARRQLDEEKAKELAGADQRRHDAILQAQHDNEMDAVQDQVDHLQKQLAAAGADADKQAALQAQAAMFQRQIAALQATNVPTPPAAPAPVDPTPATDAPDVPEEAVAAGVEFGMSRTQAIARARAKAAALKKQQQLQQQGRLQAPGAAARPTFAQLAQMPAAQQQQMLATLSPVQQQAVLQRMPQLQQQFHGQFAQQYPQQYQQFQQQFPQGIAPGSPMQPGDPGWDSSLDDGDSGDGGIPVDQYQQDQGPQFDPGA